MVEINILPTQEVEINIIKYWNNIYSLYRPNLKGHFVNPGFAFLLSDSVVSL